MHYSIKPTNHYLKYHSDVDWELVIKTILSPDKTRKEAKAGRYTYVKRFTKFVVEVHCEFDETEMIIWIINAFSMER